MGLAVAWIVQECSAGCGGAGCSGAGAEALGDGTKARATTVAGRTTTLWLATAVPRSPVFVLVSLRCLAPLAMSAHSASEASARMFASSVPMALGGTAGSFFSQSLRWYASW